MSEPVPAAAITAAAKAFRDYYGDVTVKNYERLSRVVVEAAAPVIAAQAAAAERERLAAQPAVCRQVVPPNLLCMKCFRPLCRSCGACECPENSESLCGAPADLLEGDTDA